MEDLYVKLKSLKIILKEFFLGNYFWFSAGSITMPSRVWKCVRMSVFIIKTGKYSWYFMEGPKMLNILHAESEPSKY